VGGGATNSGFKSFGNEGISFAENENKSPISFDSDSNAAGATQSDSADVNNDWFMALAKKYLSEEYLKRLLAMLGMDGGGGGGGGGGGDGGQRLGPSPGPIPSPNPGPSPGPIPSPNPGPGPDNTGPIAGIDQKQTHNVNSKSANLESYDPDKHKGVLDKTDEEITTGFVQGQEGNCATVSGIKAAMMKFGADPKDIYRSVEKTGDGYDVVQEDGTKLTLSNAELDEAKLAANFNGNDPELIKNATFMFAVSAKRAQMDHNDGAQTFTGGLNSLNNGDWSMAGFKRLGLAEFVRPATIGELASGMEVGTVDRRGHAVAVMDGREELWGSEGGRPTDGYAIKLTTERASRATA
jgi:hypothetical protein